MHSSHGLYQGIITLRTGIDRLLDGVAVPCGNIKLEPVVAREKSFTSEFQIPVLTTLEKWFLLRFGIWQDDQLYRFCMALRDMTPRPWGVFAFPQAFLRLFGFVLSNECSQRSTLFSELDRWVGGALFWDESMKVAIVLKIRLKRLEQSGIVGISIRTAQDELIIIRRWI